MNEHHYEDMMMALKIYEEMRASKLLISEGYTAISPFTYVDLVYKEKDLNKKQIIENFLKQVENKMKETIRNF